MRGSAWKFLDERSRGVFSQLVWPRPESSGPGTWVDPGGPLEPCVRGVHACRVEDLAWWLSAQLWEIELDGELLASDYSLVAARGRLVRRVEGWPEVGLELAEWAIWRTRDRAAETLAGTDRSGSAALAACTSLDDLAEVVAGLPPGRVEPTSTASLAVAFVADNVADRANPVAACHTSARWAAQLSLAPDEDQDPAASRQAFRETFAAERRAQGHWLAARLDLAGAP
jgi:hypothetical protein